MYGTALWTIIMFTWIITMVSKKNVFTVALRHTRGNKIPYVFARKAGKCPVNSCTDNRHILSKLQCISVRKNSVFREYIQQLSGQKENPRWKTASTFLQTIFIH